jgi:hypothetical protein
VGEDEAVVARDFVDRLTIDEKLWCLYGDECVITLHGWANVRSVLRRTTFRSRHQGVSELNRTSGLWADRSNTSHKVGGVCDARRQASLTFGQCHHGIHDDIHPSRTLVSPLEIWPPRSGFPEMVMKN